MKHLLLRQMIVGSLIVISTTGLAACTSTGASPTNTTAQVATSKAAKTSPMSQTKPHSADPTATNSSSVAKTSNVDNVGTDRSVNAGHAVAKVNDAAQISSTAGMANVAQQSNANSSVVTSQASSSTVVQSQLDQTSAPVTQPFSVNQTTILSAFRQQMGFEETDGSRQYQVSDLGHQQYQIDVRSQAPDPAVSNLTGVYRYDTNTQQVTNLLTTP